MRGERFVWIRMYHMGPTTAGDVRQAEWPNLWHQEFVAKLVHTERGQ